MGNINDFYYHILDIGSGDIVDIINKVISDFMSDYGITYDTVGLCKVVASVLNERFKEFGVEGVILNTKELCGCFEHEAVLVRNMDNNKLNYYLVDLTFKQFFNDIDYFDQSPVDKLIGFGKNELIFSNDLLKYGYSEIDRDLLSSYFSCFIDSSDRIIVGNIDNFFI